MAIENYEKDINDLKSDKEIADRIESDLQESISYWQSLKSKFTDYYHDYLCYKEQIRDKTKSNTVLPDAFSDVRTIKGRIKSAVLGSYPYMYAIPEGDFDPAKEMAARKKTIKFSDQLGKAKFKFYLDQWILDNCIYGTGVPRIGWQRIMKPRPAFVDTINGMLPLFEKGQRVFVERVVNDGIALSAVNIDDLFLPTYCTSIVDADWVGVRFRARIDDLAGETRLVVVKTGDGNFEFQEQYVYDQSALTRLREKKRTKQIAYKDTGEVQRKKSAYYQSIPYSGNMPCEFIEYITDGKICVKPVGEDFTIRNDANPMRMKGIGHAQILPLTNEPYGIGVISPTHKLNRTTNAMMDVMSDQLWMENNKMFVAREGKIRGWEVKSGQGNVIWSQSEGDYPVTNDISPMETRAIATEILGMVQFNDRKRQIASGAVDIAKGIALQGTNTATESAYVAQGATGSIEDYLLNLESTLGEWLFYSLDELNRINFNASEPVKIYDDTGQVIAQNIITPEEMQTEVTCRFQWAGRERARDIERAALVQELQIIGSLPPQAFMNKAVLEILKQLLTISQARNGEYIAQLVEQQAQEMATMTPPTNGQQPTAPEGGMAQNQGDVQRQVMEVIGQAMSSQIQR